MNTPLEPHPAGARPDSHTEPRPPISPPGQPQPIPDPGPIDTGSGSGTAAD